MRKYILTGIAVTLLVVLFFFIIKVVRSGDGTVNMYIGESENWESHAEVTKNETNFYLKYIGPNHYSGEVFYSYSINLSQVKVHTNYQSGRTLRDTSTNQIKVNDVKKIEVFVKWADKEESIELHPKK